MNTDMRAGSSGLVAVISDPAKGRCVVAVRPIRKGTRILADPVVVVPVAETGLMDRTVLGRYVFEWDEGVICAVLGLGSLINHGTPANVELVSNFEDRTMDFIALVDIRADEELVYDYGHDAGELEEYYGIPRASAART